MGFGMGLRYWRKKGQSQGPPKADLNYMLRLLEQMA